MKEIHATKKKSLTQTEYLMLVGLLTLAKGHHDKLVQLERAIVEHLGATYDPYDSGVNEHVSDAIYGKDDFNVDRLLELLDIEVEKGEMP